MKKKILIAVTVVIALALSTGVALADKPAPVGERIFLYDTEDNPDFPFTAGDPFHVIHGIQFYYQINEPIGNGVALSKMVLELDGEEIGADYIDYDWAAYPQYDIGWKVVTKLYTFNFPEGLAAGEHTFVRRYYFTCQSYLFTGVFLTCDHPKDFVEEWSNTFVVSFTE